MISYTSTSQYDSRRINKERHHIMSTEVCKRYLQTLLPKIIVRIGRTHSECHIIIKIGYSLYSISEQLCDETIVCPIDVCIYVVIMNDNTFYEKEGDVIWLILKYNSRGRVQLIRSSTAILVLNPGIKKTKNLMIEVA